MRPVPFSLVAAAALDGSDPRGAERFAVGLPYTLDGHQGHTRDLSATGVSFDSDIAYPVGAVVKLTLRYGLDGHNFPLPCEAEVVRVEPRGAGFTIAARLERPFFEPQPEPKRGA